MSGLTSEQLPKHDRKVGLLLPLVLALLGFIVLLIAETVDLSVIRFLDPITTKILMTTLGSIFIGTSIIEGAFQLKFHYQIQEQVSTLKRSIETLQDTVMIAKGAVDAGLTAVYATREDCLKEIYHLMDVALTDIKSGAHSKKINIAVLGISLGDFLCPHGSLQSKFRELLSYSNFTIRAAILRDDCESAIYRAIHEEPERKYKCTMCYDELRTATDYLKHLTYLKKESDHENPITAYLKHGLDQNVGQQRSVRTADPTIRPRSVGSAVRTIDLAANVMTGIVIKAIKHLTHSKENDQEKLITEIPVRADLAAYLYEVQPMVFMFVMDEEMFIENYHMAGRGGEAPILRVSQYKKQATQEVSKLYKIYMHHFESIINEKKTKEVPEEIRPTPEPEAITSSRGTEVP